LPARGLHRRLIGRHRNRPATGHRVNYSTLSVSNPILMKFDLRLSATAHSNQTLKRTAGPSGRSQPYRSLDADAMSSGPDPSGGLGEQGTDGCPPFVPRGLGRIPPTPTLILMRRVSGEIKQWHMADRNLSSYPGFASETHNDWKIMNYAQHTYIQTHNSTTRT